jgi:hypothetical protein
MKKLLLGMGYFTWMVCNLAVVYGIGYGAMKLIESTSVFNFVVNFTCGVIIVFLLVLLSVLSLGLIAMVFGDEKVTNKLQKLFNL